MIIDMFDEIGSPKPLELQSAMGLEQLKKLPQWILLDVRIVSRKSFQNMTNIYVHQQPQIRSCWFGFMTVKIISLKELVEYREHKTQDHISQVTVYIIQHIRNMLLNMKTL